MWRPLRQLIGEGLSSSLDEKGTGLIEVLVAVAIVGTALAAILAGLSTSAIATRRADQRTTVEIVARSQLEYTKAQGYQLAPATYDAFTPLPAGYSVVTDASPISGRDDDLQRITVTVSYKGEALLVVEDFKANR